MRASCLWITWLPSASSLTETITPTNIAEEPQALPAAPVFVGQIFAVGNLIAVRIETITGTATSLDYFRASQIDPGCFEQLLP